MESQNFAANLKNLLKKNRIKQKDFAEAVGINVTTISKWANGHFLPESRYVQRIANFFEISIEELLGTDKVTSDTMKRFNEMVSPDTVQTLRLIEYVEYLGHSVTSIGEQDWDAMLSEINDFIDYQFYKLNRKG